MNYMSIRIQLTSGAKINIKRAVKKTEADGKIEIIYTDEFGEQHKMGFEKVDIAYMEIMPFKGGL